MKKTAFVFGLIGGVLSMFFSLAACVDAIMKYDDSIWEVVFPLACMFIAIFSLTIVFKLKQGAPEGDVKNGTGGLIFGGIAISIFACIALAASFEYEENSFLIAVWLISALLLLTSAFIFRGAQNRPDVQKQTTIKDSTIKASFILAVIGAAINVIFAILPIIIGTGDDWLKYTFKDHGAMAPVFFWLLVVLSAISAIRLKKNCLQSGILLLTSGGMLLFTGLSTFTIYILPWYLDIVFRMIQFAVITSGILALVSIKQENKTAN